MTKKERKLKKVAGGDFPAEFRFTQEGQSLEGVYLGAREVESDAFQSGSATFHTLQVEDPKIGGKTGKVSILGSGLLNWLLQTSEVKVGHFVKITFDGWEDVVKGKKTVHAKKWTVEVEEEDKPLE